MNEKLMELVATLKPKSKGVSLQVIRQIEEKLGVHFPEDYVEVMLISDGYSGFVGKSSYLVIWSIEELEPYNEEIGMRKYAPGMLGFADNGSGSWYAFDTRASKMIIVDIPMIGGGLDDTIICGSTFTEFLEYLYNYQ